MCHVFKLIDIRPFDFLYQSEVGKRFPKLARMAHYFIEQSIAQSTYNSYKSALNQYLKFCVSANETPFPVEEVRLLCYCMHRIKKVAKNTVFKDLYAIKKFSMFMGFPVDYSKMIYLNQLKLGLSKRFGKNPPDKRLPITLALLHSFHDILDLKDYNQLMAFTAMVVATFGLLRTSEFTAAKQSISYAKRSTDIKSLKALYLSNLEAVFDKDRNVKWYKLRILASKTDVFRQNVTIILGRGKPPVCPVYLLTKMLLERKRLARTNKKL